MRTCEQLTAEADPEDRNAGGIGLAQPLDLGKQPRAELRVVPGTPGCAHGHDDVERCGIGELVGDDAGGVVMRGLDDELLNHLEAEFGEALGDQSGRAEGIVLHE